MLTKKIINKMSRREKRSAIINVSSGVAVSPMPYYSTYAATKVFDDFFSRSVGYEFKKKIDF